MVRPSRRVMQVRLPNDEALGGVGEGRIGGGSPDMGNEGWRFYIWRITLHIIADRYKTVFDNQLILMATSQRRSLLQEIGPSNLP